MKNIFVAQIILALFCSVGFASSVPQQMARPSAPNNTCGSFDQVSQYRGYVQCILNFNNQVAGYQNQVNQYNQSVSTTGGTPISGAAGLIVTPNLPQNNCGAPPSVNDTAAWQTHNQCVSTYNSNKQYYDQAIVAFNSINEQFMAQQEAAQRAEEQRLSQIQAQNQTSTTGTLQQVQNNTQSASKIYAVAGAILAGYGAYKLAQSYGYMAQCTSQNYGACVAAGVAAVAAYHFFSEKDKANGQVADFAASNVKVCQANNTISTAQQNCNASDPNSPIYNQAVNTPPNENWYDTSTGQCKPDAPQLCKDMMAGNNGYKAIGNSIPRVASNCAGGGAACMAGYSPLITQTAKGTKITIKGKDGKDYSIYPDQYRDEKSLMGAGMSAAQAKKTLAEMTAAEETAKKALADAKKAGEGIDKSSYAGIGSGIGSGGDSGVAIGLDDDAKRRRFKDDLKAAEDKRKPSSAGLIKDFHGDMIGAAGDDIFTMMNRRYQLKNEQDTFFTP